MELPNSDTNNQPALPVAAAIVNVSISSNGSVPEINVAIPPGYHPDSANISYIGDADATILVGTKTATISKGTDVVTIDKLADGYTSGGLPVVLDTRATSYTADISVYCTPDPITD